MKKIAIAGYPDQTKNYEAALSGMSVLSVTTLHIPDTTVYDGLILPGGGDIDPRLFGQLNCGSRAFDPVLDRLQLAIVHAFVLDKKPILGICKGMQLINIYFGGDICQDLPTGSEHEYIGKDQIHKTTAAPGSYLFQLYGKSFSVNSAHHQGVDLPGQGISYIQSAGDGVIEGLSHAFLPVLGVQWHPERMCFEKKRPDTADGSLLLDYFFSMTSI